jgi:hypothetical protein
MEILTSKAEKLAEMAESLRSFSGLKLVHIKKQLTTLLSLIGRDGIFDEFTLHDISHINKMLDMLDWIIPDNTKVVMSPADWLLTVLSIYFHDLGMLVTKIEYENRYSSEFPEFLEKELYSGENGNDYREKIKNLGEERGEKFAYQEFVRSKHAERIRAWITGKERDNLGITPEIVSELDSLLAPLSIHFRRDLSIVCESHHLNDLDDLNKYRTSQPYGDSEEETANTQYAAILMRTADLLHITSDRTPSISFRIINPTDPLSQAEWAKQMAVSRIRPKTGKDRENNLDPNAPKDTIEVHAYFKEANSFFGLTSYLHYAEEQLKKSYEWAQDTNKKKGIKHNFPWRYIDDSQIETEGFIKQTFEFTFDQGKILDLLTGHTLYNDIKVVLRELVQNSIDAVRLQQLMEKRAMSNSYDGEIKIYWDSKQRNLTVEDNGTGMTQTIIERNLLKVGSSRYQTEEFKIEYPEFSSISRFGIGILSTFMIADSVEIITCHIEDAEARHISLRSVHGKYLIRLLDKQGNRDVKEICPHGTRITLNIRHSVDMSDIVSTAKQWIILPHCKVLLIIDGLEPLEIGFTSPKEAVKAYLQEMEILEADTVFNSTNEIRIVETTINETTLAFAVRWSNIFREWEFLQVYQTNNENIRPYLGTCIEGIRVDFNTPGFNGYSIIAVANTIGANAPKTNVARSGFEVTKEYDEMLNSIYSIFFNHIINELKELNTKRTFSLTWAVNESRYLLNPLINFRNVIPIKENLLYERLKDLPLFLMEKDGIRVLSTVNELQKYSGFWTIEGESFRSAEKLLKEISSNASLTSLVNAFSSEKFKIPEDPILCGIDPTDEIDELVFSEREVKTINVFQEQRRVDLEWVQKNVSSRWKSFPKPHFRVEDYRLLRRGQRRAGGYFSIFIPLGEDIVFKGVTNEIAVYSFKQFYLLPNSKIVPFLLSWIEKLERPAVTEKTLKNAGAIFDLIYSCLKGIIIPPTDVETLQHMSFNLPFSYDQKIYTQEVFDIINNIDWVVFNPSDWIRRDDDDEDISY